MTDPFEAELAAMKPREPSAELKARLAARMTPASSARWICLAGLIVTALVAILIKRPLDAPIRVPIMPAPIEMLPAFDDSLPSLWAFRQAMNASPQALEAMLDRQSLRTLQPEPESTRAFPLTTADY